MEKPKKAVGGKAKAKAKVKPGVAEKAVPKAAEKAAEKAASLKRSASAARLVDERMATAEVERGAALAQVSERVGDTPGDLILFTQTGARKALAWQPTPGDAAFDRFTEGVREGRGTCWQARQAMVAAEQNASAARATMEALDARPAAGENSPVDPFADPFAVDGDGDGDGGLVDSEMADEQVSRQTEFISLSLARSLARFEFARTHMYPHHAAHMSQVNAGQERALWLCGACEQRTTQTCVSTACATAIERPRHLCERASKNRALSSSHPQPFLASEKT